MRNGAKHHKAKKEIPDLRDLADGVPQEFLHGKCIGLGGLAKVPYICPQFLSLLLQYTQLVVHLRGESKVCKGRLSVRGGDSLTFLLSPCTTLSH